jgi:hypothetical protein
MALDDLAVAVAVVVIAAFIFARVGRISLFAYRSGKRAAAMIFAAYNCALLASMLAVISGIHAGRVGRTDAFEWLAGLCLMYGCFKLWLYIRGDGPMFGSIYDNDYSRPRAAQSAGGLYVYKPDAVTRALGGEMTENECTNVMFHPNYYHMPANIHNVDIAGDK